MSVIQVQLPDELKSLIDRQITEGRVASETAFFVEAARRFVEDLAVEDEILSEARAGIADAERQRRLSLEADAVDARNPAAAERRRERTLRGLADVDAGRLIDDEAMQAWADSLGTDRELPAPEPG